MSFTNDSYLNEDQYKSKKWKLKKKKILTRDNFECKQCANRTLIDKSIKGKILKVSGFKNIEIALNRSNELFYKNAYKVEYLDDLGNKHSQNILSHLEMADFNKFIDNELYLCSIRDKTTDGAFFQDIINQKVTDTIITCIKNPYSIALADKWFYIRNLHVHHINYSYDGDISNVPDEDLVTLCARCHQNKHPHRELAYFCD